MSVRLDVYCFGTTPAELAESAPAEVSRWTVTDPRRLSQIDFDRLNGLAKDASGEFFAVWDRPTSCAAARFGEAAEALDHNPAGAVAIFFDATHDLIDDIWRQLPPRLASLAWAADCGTALVFRRSAFERIGPFLDVGRPAWDWLIRAAAADRPILSIANADRAETSISDAADLPALVPTVPDQQMGWLARHLHTVDSDEIDSLHNECPDASALRAGLFQLHDFLDESHRWSQNIEGRGRHRSGDYWHAVMHRREPDYSNSKYWFRRVGPHPVFAKLGRIAADTLAASGASDAQEWHRRLLLPSGWDPFVFVDLCEHCSRSSKAGALSTAARKIQLAEMLLLLMQTFVDATG